jgi:TetR/AcrR family transcriptional repressor of lmrAB and yxaGH operons
MGKKKASTPPEPGSRDRMIRSMGRLLRRQGYAATGLQQVVADAEAPIGSMYFHVPNGKEQLAAEAIARSGSELVAHLAALLGAADSASAVRAIAAAMGADLKRSRWHNGCPIATPALEMAAMSAPIRHATNVVFDQWELLFVQRMKADGIPLARARAIAQTIVAVLEGALIVARTRQSVEPLDNAAGLLADWIAAEASADVASASARVKPARPRKASP